MRFARFRLLIAALVSVTLILGCAGAKTAAQRIDDAAALIGKSVNAGADDVKSTLRSTIRPADDDAFAASLEQMVAAQPTWKSKAWSAAKATAEVVRSEPVSIAADLVCEGLERWQQLEQVYDADLESWAVQLSGRPATDPAVQSAIATARSSLVYHGQGDLAYISWIRDVACLVDAIP